MWCALSLIPGQLEFPRRAHCKVHASCVEEPAWSVRLVRSLIPVANECIHDCATLGALSS